MRFPSPSSPSRRCNAHLARRMAIVSARRKALPPDAPFIQQTLRSSTMLRRCDNPLDRLGASVPSRHSGEITDPPLFLSVLPRCSDNTGQLARRASVPWIHWCSHGIEWDASGAAMGTQGNLWQQTGTRGNHHGNPQAFVISRGNCMKP